MCNLFSRREENCKGERSNDGSEIAKTIQTFLGYRQFSEIKII